MEIPQGLYYQEFETVFASYYSLLCSYAFTFVKDSAISEDIVQEVFTRVWESRKDLILTDRIRFYLFTAVRNNCISHLRKEKSTGTRVWNDPEAWNGHIEPARDAGDSIDYEQMLEEAISRLSPKCKEVFVLSRLSNMKYKEIADTLGISVKTVENQLGKALKKMRAFLKDKGVQLILTGFL